MIKIFLISFTFFVFSSGAIISEKCNNVSLTEEEVKSLKEVAKNLKTFLKRNSDGEKSIQKVLEEYNSTLSRDIKLTKESSNDEVLLQHQLILHQEMKEMFSEIKQLILFGHKPSDYAESKIENEAFLFDQEKNDEKKDSMVKTLDSRDDNKIDIIDNFSSEKTNIYIPTDTTFRPADCSDLLVAGHLESEIYKIYPSKCRCTKPVKVFSDMDTDGGGWTIFLSRMNTSKPVNFTRNWEDYKNGFGTAKNEYWIGNEVLHIMTAAKNYILRMEVKDGFGRAIWGEWNSFSVASEDDKYQLLVTSYNSKSTAFNSFSLVNGNQFSTFDMDNDKHTDSCSESYKGGWWYNDCYRSNPTGIYGKKSVDGMSFSKWSTTDDQTRYATWLQLKIRPKVCSSPISVVQLNKHNCALNE